MTSSQAAALTALPDVPRDLRSIVRMLVTLFDTPEEMRAAAVALRRLARTWLPIPQLARTAAVRLAAVLDAVATYVWGEAAAAP